MTEERRIDPLQDEVKHLRRALESRATIEQAKGIIMATMRCSPDKAFTILNEQSQRENRKLREIAEELVDRQYGGSG